MAQWTLIDQTHAIAIASFTHSNPYTLSFKLGDLLILKEETRDWYRGHLSKSPDQLGIFPKSFVKAYDPRLLNHSDPSVAEIEATLREWTSVWLKKYDECDKRKITHNLMSYFKSVLYLKNVIVENKASIDEVKEMKKSTMSKILQGNSLLGLDVIAFDSNYNRLSVDEATTTIQLYEELKKNSEYSSHPAQHLIMNGLTSLREDSFISEGNLTHFQHKSSYQSGQTGGSGGNTSRNTSPTYCLKLSLESLSPSAHCNYSDENSELCINLFMYKENSAENSFYLCETAAFNMSQIPNAKKTDMNSFPILSDVTSLSPLLQNAHTGKYAIFCDLSEKDFDMTKSGYKLLLVVYAVKNIKQNNMDRHASISKIFAGGVCDLGSNLCNIVFVNTDVRNVQGSMSLYMNEFDNSIVTFKTLQEFVNMREVSDGASGSTSRHGNNSSGGGGGGSRSSSSKDAFLTLTFRTELNELPFNKIVEKYGHLQPKIFRKMDFPEVIMPDDFRNDFYVTVVSGEFQKAKNYEFVVNLVQFREESSSRWVEVPVDFSDELADPADCSGGGGKKRHLFFHKSIVYVKQDKPKWNEIVKVSIPNGKKVEEIRKLYLRFLIRSRSLDGKDKTKIVGVCYLQITNENGSAIQDCNRCYLQMNKLENENESTSLDGYYYQLKHTQFVNKSAIAQLSSVYSSSDRLKDFIEIKVKVVSTQLTQNATLLNLLSFPTDIRPDVERYKSLNNYLSELLSFKDNEQAAEIVKFLQAILDKLIDILLDLRTKHTKELAHIDEQTLEMHSKLVQPRVFEILVNIFQIIESQSRFASFRTVIDAYLSKNFCITLAHRPLLRIFKDMITRLYDKYSSSCSGGGSPSMSTNNATSNLKPAQSESSLLMYPLPGSPLARPRQSTQSSNLNNNSNHSNNSSLHLAAAVEMPSNDKEYVEAIKTIKSMEFIFKFAFRSRELLSIYSRSNSSSVVNGSMNGGGESFDQDIADIFVKLTDIATLRSNGSTEDGNLTRIQSYVLKYVIGLLPILIQSKRYTFGRISELYLGFLQSRYILTTNFLSKFIKTRLFEQPESRRVVMGHVCSALNNLLTNPTAAGSSSEAALHPSDEKLKLEQRLDSVGRVVSELMDVLERRSTSKTSSQDVSDVCRLLPNLCNTFLYFFEYQERKLKQQYGTILIAIMRLMDSSHYELYFNSPTSFLSLPFHTTIDQFLHRTSLVLSTSPCINIEERVNKMLIRVKSVCEEDTLGQLAVVKLIYTCKVLLEEETFPRDWFDLQALRNSVILSCMHHIANRISKHHVETFGQLNKQIWQDYFISMVNLTTDSCLQLESFNENKRKNVTSKYGDMRIRAAEEIKKMWYNLGNKKQHFLPQIVEPFMRVAILPISEVHHSVIPLFFDMITCEHVTKSNKMTTNSSFDEYTVPRQLITTIDSQICFGYGDVKFRNNIEKILKERFSAHVILKNNVDFVNSLVELIDLLIEYRELKEESFDELKTFYLNEILTFYGNMKRYDIYVKYVEILRAIHKSSKNPVCAAYTLKLHADLLFWTNEPLETYLQHPSHPNQSRHKDLKELLYEDLVHNFTEGQAWEKAFELSKILRGIYESEYKLEKLYKFLREEAELCENIVKKDRYECNYYSVGFFGKRFPKLLQNKRFVFRSHPFEQIMSFRQRVENWFPKSIRITHSNPVSEAEMQADAQYIQIISVLPVFEPKEQFKQLSLSTKILKYYHHNEVNKFKFTYRKDAKLNEDDPTLWWLKETVIIISNTLPDVVTFYPVVQETCADISPIQSAITTVKDRLDKLREVCAHMQRNRQVTVESKSLIQGTIDAGVLGGLPKFKKFFAQAYLEANPESTEQVEELKKLAIDTINQGETILDLALEIQPNEPLLIMLKDEQLIKLKLLFDMSVQPTMRLRRPTASTTNPTMSMMNTTNTTTTSSLMNTNQSHSSSNESIMGPIVPFTSDFNNVHATPSKHISNSLNLISKASFLKERVFFPYLSGNKNNSSSSAATAANNQEKLDKLSNQLSFSTTNSHRDSMSSIKSDEILNLSQQQQQGSNGVATTTAAVAAAAARIIFELDETVNPKRPPRPPPKPNNLFACPPTPPPILSNISNGGGTSTSASSSSSSDSQSSRPVSHLSQNQNQSINGGENINTNDSIINLIQDIHDQSTGSNGSNQENELMSSSLLITSSQILVAAEEETNTNNEEKSLLANEPPPKPPKLVKKIS